MTSPSDSISSNQKPDDESDYMRWARIIMNSGKAARELHFGKLADQYISAGFRGSDPEAERNIRHFAAWLDARQRDETSSLQLLREARSFIQHDKRCWGATHEDDCTCGYVEFAKKLAFLDARPEKETTTKAECDHYWHTDGYCVKCEATEKP